MANDWTSKEKIALLSNILEFGDQNDSWTFISNDLSTRFQTKKEGRYTIKNCKIEYKNLVDRYKSDWIQHGSANGLKFPLAKYIWIQLKSIYQTELTYQLKENRKKLTEFYLQLEATINNKQNILESTPITSGIENSTPILHQNPTLNPNEEQQENIIKIEQILHPISDILVADPSPSNLPQESNSSSLTTENNLKDEVIINDQTQIKEETTNEIQTEKIVSPNPPIVSEIEQISTESPSITHPILLDHQSISQITPQITTPPPTTTTTTTSVLPESTSSSRSNSRTSSETKMDTIKIIPTTTQKYHVYFSPKNSITNNIGTTKTKPKRKANDDIKEENDNDTINHQEQPSSLNETSKSSSTNTPMTRRSINTRSVPNIAQEQEEEKSRRFSAMLSENPNSWQSQSMAIIQFILAHKQGYLFEHEITDDIAPKYHLYIRRPVALDTIRKTLEANGYQTKDYFKRDIYLMLYNAMKYNPRYHHVHRSAKHLFTITNPLFNLSSQEIYAQITTKTNVTPSTTVNDNPLVKRQKIK